METGNSWGSGEGWPNVARLIELARRPEEVKWTAERRERFFRRVVERADKERERRRLRRAFLAGAATVLLIGALLKLIGAVAPPTGHSSPELAGRAAAHQLATE